MKNTVLSLFPGIDGLGRGFTAQGFNVVRGPDKILGEDIRGFTVPRGFVEGVIGGPPCQSYSRLNPKRSSAMHWTTREFLRVVDEARPKWFLMENVQGVPSVSVEGYAVQRFTIDLAWFTQFSRSRVIQFGSLNGRLLNPMQGKRGHIEQTAIHGNSDLTFEAMRDLTGFPPDMTLPSFNKEGKRQAVANAVPLVMAQYLAGLVKETMHGSARPDMQPALLNRCGCGCGREIIGRKKYACDTCRWRAWNARQRAG